MRRGLSEHVPSVLVATLSAAFGVSLLEVTSVLATVISANEVTGSSSAVGMLLFIVAIVFIVIAVYVGTIVTSNTFSTIIAGRTRTIALLRLVGSSAADQRRSVAREGLAVGVVGAILGAVVGTLVTMLLVAVSVSTGFIPMLGYAYLQPVLLLPIIAVVLTTWLASWIGSRRVLHVSPMQATGVAIEMSREEAGGRRGRNVVAITLFATGIGFLVSECSSAWSARSACSSGSSEDCCPSRAWCSAPAW